MEEVVIDAGELIAGRARERAEQEVATGRGVADLKSGRKAPPKGAKTLLLGMAVVVTAIIIGLALKAYYTQRQVDGSAARRSRPERVERTVPALQLERRRLGQESENTLLLGDHQAVVPASVTGFEGLAQPQISRPVELPSEPALQMPPAPTAETGQSTSPTGFAPERKETVQDRRLSRGFGGAGAEEGGLAPVQYGGGPAPNSTPPGGKAGGLEEKLEVTELKGTTAMVLSDRDYWLTQGAMLDCVLETKIVSTVAGMVSCHLTRDAYSTSGQVVLLDRGTKLVGRYQGGMQQGESRVFVVWTRAETPRGVVVALDSPGTGALGEAGIGGWVDQHFWDRFGAAILVSMIQAGTDAVAARVAGPASRASISVQGATSASNDLVGKTFDSTIGMSPTLYVNQGERISIFVARDLSFRSVYGLELARHDEP